MTARGLALALAGALAAAQTPLLTEAQARLRAGDLAAAEAAFTAWLQDHPQDADALVGAGFTALRQQRLAEAEARFTRALALARSYADAHYGLGLVRERRGEAAGAKAAFAEALRLEPGREEFRTAHARALAQVPDPLPPFTRPEAPQRVARVRPGGFERWDGQAWRPLFLKGINLGAALPGKYPSEFPDKATYAAWFRDMAEVGFNALRVYTIHPPAFYEALREHNLATPAPLYLVHGVWAEPPPDDEFTDPAWFGAFKAEMRAVVDLLHGRANLPPRPGHASGMYRADVSPWWIGTILGREWEPFNVVGFNEHHPGVGDFQGRFLSIRGGHATERFMVESMDAFLAYDHDTYNGQRPIATTNWPTLDPMAHPTESTKEEEDAWRRRLGIRLDPGQVIREFDNDAVGLDMEKVQDTALFQAGCFASFHAYPYYPDFMNLDPGYAKARDAEGPNAYFGYLQDLVRHHQRHLVVISEFGVPSSRLVAHWQPQGFTHGGQNEREQGEQDARLFRNLHEAGTGGGFLFAWIDEWFKKNWLVIDFEEPLERKPLWYNAQDAEENYGLLGMHPGTGGPSILIDGKAGDWSRVPPYLQGQGLTLKALADEGWLHLAVTWDPAVTPKPRFLVGLDTLDPKLGDHRLPFGLPLRSDAGLEFALELGPEGCALWVDEPYDLFTHRYDRPYRTVAHDRGIWVRPRTESNRARIGRDGTRFPFRRQEIGTLRRGTQDRRDPAFDSGAEWLDGPGFLEVRLPWGLLNVTDPSQRRVVQDPLPPGEGVGTVLTDGFRMVLVQHTPSPESPRILAALPAPRNGTLPIPPTFAWPTWEQPTWHAFRKQSFDLLKAALRALPDTPRIRP